MNQGAVGAIGKGDREADGREGGDEVGHPCVLHAVLAQGVPLPGVGEVDGVEARARLGREAVVGEEAVQGEGGVEGELDGLEDVEGLEGPGLDLCVREAPGGVEERDVEADAVEGAEARGGVQEGEEV